jgi:hypothetical protein
MVLDQLSDGQIDSHRSRGGEAFREIEVELVGDKTLDSNEQPNYDFYDIQLQALTNKNRVHLDSDSEVAIALGYLSCFLEQGVERQVVAMTFPLSELEMFFA